MKTIIKAFLKTKGLEIVRYNPAPINFQSILSLLNPKNFFFIQIGANDGVKNDPINKFVTKHNLSGIMVEPQKLDYPKKNKLIYENVAISNKNGFRSLYVIKKSFHEEYQKHTNRDASNISSFNKDHVRKFLCRGMEYLFKKDYPDSYIEEIIVPTLTFNSLMEKHKIKKIDLLQIDTEGYDYEIIKTINFSKYSPKIINYESAHLNSKDRDECEKHLINLGYRLLRDKGDTCAIIEKE